jgi:hypothetical protein
MGASVRVTGALLFVGDDNWSLLDFRPLRFGDVYVLWGRALGKLIRANGTNGCVDVSHDRARAHSRTGTGISR